METCGVGNGRPVLAVTARQEAWCVYFELIKACKGAGLAMDDEINDIHEHIDQLKKVDLTSVKPILERHP